MNIYKRIISLFVAFAMCISLMVVPASANALVPAGGYLVSNFSKSVALGAILSESFGFMECSGEYLSTLWDAMNTGVCDGCEVNPNGQHDFMPTDILVTSWEAALRGSEACDCRYCGISYDEFWDSTYNQYASSLQTDLGSTTLIDGGVRVYFPSTSYEKGNLTIEDISLGTCSRVFAVNSSSSSSSVSFLYGTISAPFACNFTTDMAYASNIVPHTFHDSPPYYFHSGTASSGGKIFLLFETTCRIIFTVPADSYVDAVLYAYADCIPIQSIDSLTSQDITINSRPTSITGDYGIIGDNGTIVHIEGNKIVDETGGTVYNPATGETQSYTEYAYDYSDRSYLLTLEDGNTIKVMYGDANVTIQEGDTIYNIYYLIPDDSGSGDEPGTGDDPGSGDTPGGEDMSWWKEAWTNFTDKLFSILGNGGSSVNPDTAPAVPDDEEAGEKGYSIIDLFVVLKDGTWAFITGIVTTAYDGFTGFVESVSSAGSFFTFYDEESEDGILFVPLEGGETIWD